MLGVGVTVVGFVLVVAVLLAVLAVKNLIIIAPPNRAAVITGRTHETEDGQEIGYRLVIGGRTFRIPIVETVEWMSLETIPIEIKVTNALSSGHIPLVVDAIANVKIASHPPQRAHNAVERLLDKSEEEIHSLAKEALTGALRGVVAQMTPEEVNEDRLAFANQVDEEAAEDLAALGFELDVFKIQNVADDKGYLDAIGRERSAEAIRDAEIAEAEAEAETRERQAQENLRAEKAEAEADVEIAEAHNKVRVREAELDEEGETAERTAKVNAERAEVEAQRELEEARVERERESYRANVVVPAEAEREAAEEEAKAEAAPIRERGKAEAEALEEIYSKIQEGGEEAVRVFLARMLPDLLGPALESMEGMDVDRLVVIDDGDGQGMANAGTQRLRGAYGILERLGSSAGLDVEKVLRGLAERVADEDVGLGESGDSEESTGGVPAPTSERAVDVPEEIE